MHNLDYYDNIDDYGDNYIVRIFDLYNGVINERNIDDIKAIM